MVECAEEAERKGVNQQGEQAVDRACCTRQISQLIHERRRKHRHEAGCDDKERRGGVEELGDARNDTAGLFAKHPQRRRPLPVGVGEVGGHVVLCVRPCAARMANERARARRNYANVIRGGGHFQWTTRANYGPVSLSGQQRADSCREQTAAARGQPPGLKWPGGGRKTRKILLTSRSRLALRSYDQGSDFVDLLC